MKKDIGKVKSLLSRNYHTNIFIIILSLCVLCGTYANLNENVNLKEKEKEYSSSLLEVFLVPHSHCDPGWWYSAEVYYTKWTRGIIDSVVTTLSEDRRLRFIWAEVYFFERWWQEQSEVKRNQVHEIVKNGQLEFVTGGWIMPDEASPYFVDIINQLVEGNIWLQDTFNILPKYGWAIDPFGHSLVHPYLLQAAGIESIVINRIPVKQKEKFRKEKSLEIFWKYPWLHPSFSNLDPSYTSNGMLTHIFPYPYYDIPNTCGPSWDTCAQFDFEREVAVEITKKTVAARADIIISMYKQKSADFPHNLLLIPLGDDFKYKTLDFSRKMFQQYQLLIDYINSNLSKYNAHIQWASLSEYFDELRKYVYPKEKLSTNSIQNYVGDFFTYIDKDTDYWSGYFTTRPFQKHLARHQSGLLRAAEILYALSTSRNDDFFSTLQSCRRQVSLFQHHDAITGTSRKEVVNDYTNRLYQCWNLDRFMEDSVMTLLSRNPLYSLSEKSGTGINTLQLGISQEAPKKLISLKLVNIDDFDKAGVIVLFNSIEQTRVEISHIRVSFSKEIHEISKLLVFNEDFDDIPFQLNPVFHMTSPFSPSQRIEYDLYFPTSVPSLGISTFFLVAKRVDSGYKNHDRTSLKFFSSWTTANELTKYFSPHVETEVFGIEDASAFDLTNDFYTASFFSSGFLESIHCNKEGNSKNERMIFHQKLAYYDSTRKGGAYIFSPSGPSNQVAVNNEKHAIRIIKGPLVEEVSVFSGEFASHVIRLFKAPRNLGSLPGKFIEVKYSVDLTNSAHNNKDLIATFETNLKNDGKFYTDNNGFAMSQRQFDSRLPIQGNYYPISTCFCFSDSERSVTFTTAQPHGITIRSHGSDSQTVEIMLDRRLSQDDGRGLGESVQDNLLTDVSLWISFDPPLDNDESILEVPSFTRLFNYPLIPFLGKSLLTQNSEEFSGESSFRLEWNLFYLPKFLPMHNYVFPSNLHLVNLRKRDDSTAGWFIHIFNPSLTNKAFFDCSVFLNTNEKAILSERNLVWYAGNNYKYASFNEPVEISPMEIKSLVFELSDEQMLSPSLSGNLESEEMPEESTRNSLSSMEREEESLDSGLYSAVVSSHSKENSDDNNLPVSDRKNFKIPASVLIPSLVSLALVALLFLTYAQRKFRGNHRSTFFLGRRRTIGLSKDV